MQKKQKLSKLPRVKRRPDEQTDFPVDYFSYSSMGKFSSNPLMFKIQYINRDIIESAHSSSSVLGNAFHKAIDVFFTTDDADPVAAGLKAGMIFIEEYPEGFIKWTKTLPDRQCLLEKLAFAYGNRVHELRRDKNLIGSEQKYQQYVDVEYRKKKISLPIALKGYIDRIKYDDQRRVTIEDDKITASFSDPEKIDGRKILQAIHYYFLVYAELGKEPYSMTFVESKHTKSKDGEQTRRYTIVYEDNQLFFDFYLRFYGDIIKALMGEQVFVPNIDTFTDNEIGIIAYTHHLDDPVEKAKQEKRLKVENISEILRKKIASSRNMKALKNSVEKSLVEYKSINYEKMEIQEKISTKLMEHGIVLHYDSKVEGNSFIQYRFTPSIGVKMKSLAGYSSDIEQATGASGVRIVAPIADTMFVGVEIPKKNRTFITLSDKIIGEKKDGLPIGEDQNGDSIRLSLDEMPHMLVSGSTGSGKSAFLNVIIKSLLKQGHTHLQLIDPKQVELSQFADQAEKIAYEPLEAAQMLAQLVLEMQFRYGFMRGKKKVNYQQVKLEPIVCVIDEFADLIMSSRRSAEVSGEQVEDMIVRLAQKGRAAGIHLIIATQRPDSKIITGLIKANFPTKVAFHTSSEVNSRIILDEEGAEKLLGRGDGLIASPSLNGIKRFQGYSLIAHK